MTRIKICGITSLEVALAAAESGADALGFVFAPSSRRIQPDLAREIISQLPPFVIAVGVFVNEKPEVVCQIAEYCRLHLIQLHGEETPEYCQNLNWPVVKAIRVAAQEHLAPMAGYRVQGFVLDSLVAGQQGGTGKTLPWELAREAAQYGKIILAGGLSQDNVTTAISRASPYGVDVSSGVETDGVKDLAKIREFTMRVRRFNNG